MEIVKKEDLKRYAVIDMLDIILFDSDNKKDCLDFYEAIGGNTFCRGVYDYQEEKYIQEN